jgi:2,3-bisphosphoglycerate-dependent phosphoglycerate mutase
LVDPTLPRYATDFIGPALSLIKGDFFMTVVRVCLLLLLLVSLPSFATKSFALEDEFKVTTVFLVRHAEKADEPRPDPPLIEKGVARSQELARLLSAAHIKAIFTSQFLRTKQTAEPLAKQLGLRATTFALKSNPARPREIAVESTTELANKILEHSGESVLVVGHTNSIPDLIKMLGGDVVPTIDEKTFDDLFVVTVFGKGKAKVVQMKYGSAE